MEFTTDQLNRVQREIDKHGRQVLKLLEELGLTATEIERWKTEPEIHVKEIFVRRKLAEKQSKADYSIKEYSRG